MIEKGIQGKCEECVDRSRITLVGLANQYVSPGLWLKNGEHDMLGDYSLLAIHAMERRLDLDRPSLDIRAPFLNDNPYVEADESILSKMSSILTVNTLDPDTVRGLREVAQRRKRSYDKFLNNGRRYWEEQVRKAIPFLDQLAKPDRDIPNEKRRKLSRVYWLDQGPFIVARTALDKCPGLWFRLCPFGERFERFNKPIQQQA